MGTNSTLSNTNPYHSYLMCPWETMACHNNNIWGKRCHMRCMEKIFP